MSSPIQSLAPSALIGLISAVLVLVWFYTLWQRVVVDQTRQRLFELRDWWFDTCADANALQTHGARFVREVLNGEIRFAHRRTLPSALVYLLVGRNVDVEKTIEAAMASAMETLDPSLRPAAQSVLQSASWHITSAVVRRSLFAVIIVPFAPIMFLAFSPALTRRRFLGPLSRPAPALSSPAVVIPVKHAQNSP